MWVSVKFCVNIFRYSYKDIELSAVYDIGSRIGIKICRDSGHSLWYAILQLLESIMVAYYMIKEKRRVKNVSGVQNDNERGNKVTSRQKSFNKYTKECLHDKIPLIQFRLNKLENNLTKERKQCATFIYIL